MEAAKVRERPQDETERVKGRSPIEIEKVRGSYVMVTI